MTTQSKAIINGTLEYRQFIILSDGTEIRVRYNQDKELYNDTDIQVYAYTAKESIENADGTKTKVDVTRYAVNYDDVIKSTRESAKAKIDNMLADIASGLSASEILAKYQK